MCTCDLPPPMCCCHIAWYLPKDAGAVFLPEQERKRLFEEWLLGLERDDD